MKKSYDQPRQHIKKQRHYFANRGQYSQGYGFSRQEYWSGVPLPSPYDQPRQHIKKQRYYFANKALSSQTMIFPVVMYGYESWTIKKAEH